jgi:tetraacyldisaccharide 4'-kinase
LKSILNILRPFLIPFSFLFYIIVQIRNFLYDKNYFKIKKLPRPIISIGNISTGGTGKTPFVILTARKILESGLTVGIISRGYNRFGTGLVKVSDGYVIINDYKWTGDELSMIAEELINDFKGQFSIVASEDRYTGLRYLYEKFQPDVFILDDGFQHRKIKRNLDIVLIDAEDFRKHRFLNSFLLPAGELRERISNIRRADLIIQNNKTSAIKLKKNIKRSRKPYSIIRYDYEYFVGHENLIFENVKNNVILVSGIAKPESLRNILIKNDYKITDEIIFEDHHIYTSDDIEKIKKHYKKDSVIVTTQKDFIKLREYESFLKDYPVYYLKLNISFTDGEDEFSNLINTIIEQQKNRISKIQQ